MDNTTEKEVRERLITLQAQLHAKKVMADRQLQEIYNICKEILRCEAMLTTQDNGGQDII